jgi:PEGA domain-containing protein
VTRPARCSLVVDSSPAGASVYVDGRLAGETPLTLPAIAAGLHRVRVVRLGYLENSRLVTVKSGARATLRARLTDPAPQAAPAAALKIVVLEGEGAVNIIQQKTAVAPVIEVRDRNDQPVAGALVRFAIQTGRASFNGARTLTATTDALGRATATGLTPTGGGPLHIGVSAAFQGQTAAITIAQTNVLTAAQASAAAASGSGTAGGGGGLSHLALAGIVGGAGAGIGAAVLASRKNTPAITSRTLTGPFNTQFIMTTFTGSTSCASTRSISGTVTIQLDERSEGTVTGQGSTSGTESETAVTQSPFCQASFGTVGFAYRGAVTGSTGNMTFNQQTISTSTSPATVTVTNTFAFTGTLSNGVITGTVTYSEASSGQSIPPFNTPISGSGSTNFAVILR